MPWAAGTLLLRPLGGVAILSPQDTTECCGSASSAWAGWEQEERPGTALGSSTRQGLELESHPPHVRCGNQLGTSLHPNGSLLLCAAAVSVLRLGSLVRLGSVV